jgi:hypothetical protein
MPPPILENSTHELAISVIKSNRQILSTIGDLIGIRTVRPSVDNKTNNIGMESSIHSRTQINIAELVATPNILARTSDG